MTPQQPWGPSQRAAAASQPLARGPPRPISAPGDAGTRRAGPGSGGRVRRRGGWSGGCGRAGRASPPVAGQPPPRLAGDRQPCYPHPPSAGRSHWLPPRCARLPLSARRRCRVLIGALPSGHAASLSHTIPPAFSASCEPPGGRGLGSGSCDWREELPLRARAGAGAAGLFKGASRRRPVFSLVRANRRGCGAASDTGAIISDR